MNPGEGFGSPAAAAALAADRADRGADRARILAATRLDTNAGTDTLVDEGSGEFGATERFHEDFGDEPVIVLVEEDLQKLVLTRDLQSLFELETSLAGGTQLAESLPRREKEPLPAVCNRIAQLQPSRAVFGPATFLYLSVAGSNRRSRARSAERSRPRGTPRGRAKARRRAGAVCPGAGGGRERRGAADPQPVPGQPRPGRPPVWDHLGSPPRRPAVRQPGGVRRGPAPGTPKERFGYLFPNKGAAQIIVRLRPDLTDQERHDAIGLFRRRSPTRDSD